MSVHDWRRLRCNRCGGPSIVEETHKVERLVEPALLDEGKPKRGRPSKRMLELRRQEQERLQRLAS